MIALLPLAGGCSAACKTTMVKSVDAPDARHSAAIFQRDCGATTGFSTQVSVIRPGEHLSGVGNAFIADDDHGAAPAGSWGGPWAEVQWVASNHLLIRFTSKSRIFDRADHVNEIRVTYQTASK